MRIAYFDCFSGISGDMIVGALIDSRIDFEVFKTELEKLDLKGYSVSFDRVIKNGITGTKFNVVTVGESQSRNLDDILKIIGDSRLDEDIKNKCMDIFKEIARVEAGIHGKNISEIHFHEVGAIDSIVDIVGAVIGLNLLGVQEVYSSPVHLGKGFADTMHGKIPVPSPATVELLKGAPVFSKGIESELTTPTGAAIIKYFSKEFRSIPGMIIECAGYGAGTKDLEIPNMLRVFIGSVEDSKYEAEVMIMLETNIDDMNPEIYGYVAESLMEKGALDVYTTQVIMKKSRPGLVLNVLTTEDKLSLLMDTIFLETSTSGIRVNRHTRYCLKREIKKVKTKFGDIDIKLIYTGEGSVKASPEYESCKSAAIKYNVPVMDVYDNAKAAALHMLK